jgi:hypothetical protein
MPTPPLHHPHPELTRHKVYRVLLDFLSAMRTAPAMTADEAIEWARLEQEFTNRTQDTHNENAA